MMREHFIPAERGWYARVEHDDDGGLEEHWPVLAWYINLDRRQAGNAVVLVASPQLTSDAFRPGDRFLGYHHPVYRPAPPERR
jgi:hypothetical protein